MDLRSRPFRAVLVAVLPAVALVGCAGTGEDGADGSESGASAITGDVPTSAEAATTTAFQGETGAAVVGPDDRPAELLAPPSIDGVAPLLVVLHGYGLGPDDVDTLFDAGSTGTDRGMYVLLPTGSEDAGGNRFWDASEACCDYHRADVDDVAYLRDLVDEVSAERPIDPSRIYLLGHSNGGFMAYRAACELSGRVAAVAVLAGADAAGDGGCALTAPVSVLHLHGDADTAVPYEGGEEVAPYPGAVETVGRWAERDGCGPGTEAREPVDLVADLPGAETTVEAHTGCPDGVDVELATIAGGEHEPELDPDAVGSVVLDWLAAHRR